MAYGNPNSRGQLGISMPDSTVEPVDMEDLERQRRALEQLGLDKVWLGDVNAWRSEKVAMRDSARDDLRNRVLGSGSGGPSAAVASKAGGGLGDVANQAAKSALKNSAMSAAGAAL